MDSLRYWVEHMGVDGFRFDLTMALARTKHGVDPQGPLFTRIAADPILANTRLIAEPWDLGPEGYGMGRFGPRWKEWNGPFRDTIRDLWAGTCVNADVLHRRLCGSPDLFAERGAQASVNFVTCHDGFTLADWTAFQRKRNRANGEDNRDGSNDNRSPDTGVDGPTDDPAILALRDRLRRAMLATLVLADGIVMLLGGDELGRTQRGNNNAYCQDNALSWTDWDGADDALTSWLATLLNLRRQHPLLGRVEALTTDTLTVQHAVWVWHRADNKEAVMVVFCPSKSRVIVPPPGRWTPHWCSDPLGSGMTVPAQSVTVFTRAQPRDASEGVSGGRGVS